MCQAQNIRPDFRVDDDQHGRLHPVEHFLDDGGKIDREIERIPFTILGKALDGDLLSGFCNG